MPIHPIIVIAVIMCGSAVVITAMLVVAHLLSQRRRLAHLARSDDIAQRLERIEQIAESTAIEIERLSESNRYVTRLLAERNESAPR